MQAPRAQPPDARLTRRQFLKVSLATVATVGLGTGSYSWLVEPHWLEFVRLQLPISNLPAALERARLVQLSDIHIGPFVSDDYVLGTFRRVAELRPDIVVVTGDFVTYDDDIVAHARRIYAHLPHGRLATIGTLGNHDYGYGPDWSDYAMADRLAGALTEQGVRVLRNEVARVAGLQVVGMDDLQANRFDPTKAFEGVDMRQPLLGLSHDPDTVDLPGWGDFDGWTLAGHTHGGQVKPPFLPPPVLPVKNRRYTSGEFEISGGRHLYINRGVGHWLPIRFNCRPEVTVFELRRA